MALSNFYTDFSFTDTDFNNILGIYKDLITAINNYARQVKNNSVISKIETYRNLDMQRLSIKDAMYPLNAILENINTVKRLGLEEVGLKDRIDAWNNDVISDEQKIDILNLLGHYVQFSTKRGFQGEKEYNIIDLTLNKNQNEFIRNYDYYLRNNRLFLLRSLSDSTITSDKDFSIRNISIDYDTAEELVGKDVKVLYTDVLTKNEYNELVKMLLYASLGGPTVANLKSAISSITGLGDVKIYDKYARDIKLQQKWTEPGSLLHDFDFVVSMPAEYTTSTGKLNIILSYLKMIKPAFADFNVITNSFYDEFIDYSLEASDVYFLDNIKEVLDEIYNFAGKAADAELLNKVKEIVTESLYRTTVEGTFLDKIIAIPDYDVLSRMAWSDSYLWNKLTEILTDDYLHTRWDDPSSLFKIVENNTEATYNRNDDSFMLDAIIGRDSETARRAVEFYDFTEIIEAATETYDRPTNESYILSTITDTSLPSYTNGDTLLNDSFNIMSFAPTVQTVNY